MPTARRTTRVRLITRPAASTPRPPPPPPTPAAVYRDGLTAAHEASAALFRHIGGPAFDAPTADTFRDAAADVARLAALVESLDDGDPYGPRRFLSALSDVGAFFRYRADKAAGTLPPL